MKVFLSELSHALKSKEAEIIKAVRNGVIAGAKSGKRTIQAKTPVASGELKKAWEVREVENVELVNTAPYSGVVERGAKPHTVGMQGIERIQDWAVRKLGLSEKEARNLAFGVAKKIQSQGQAPTFFVLGALGELAKDVKTAVEQELMKIRGSKR